MNAKYTVVRKLGQGGFGHVFLVKNSRQEKRVIKTIQFKDFSQYVVSELNILKNLDHPRIIKLIEFFPSNEGYNFVMEYAENGTLRDLIFKYQQHKWKISAKDLRVMFMEIAYGLRFLHSKGVIHRDMKPENILLASEYRVKIADFGVSKIVKDCPEKHTSIGTLSYMSPEVYLHQPYDKSCDIWGLGIMFYEMAKMKYPFTNIDKRRILNPVLSYVCPKVDWESRHYNPRLQEVLEMMLQRDPKKRKDINIICSHPSLAPEFKMLERESYIYSLKKRNSI